MRLTSLQSLLSGVACAAVAVGGPAACGQVAGSSSTEAPTASVTAPHFPSNEDLRHLKTIGAPLLSPDGKLVLFTVTEATADDGKTHLWLAWTAAGSGAAGSDKARQITFSAPTDKRGERGAQWAPDGTAIYFLAKRGEQTQLFRLDMRGGEASPYDLKVMPVVDESKIQGAIPPPGAAAASAAMDKSSDKKDDGKKADDKSAEKKKGTPAEPLPLDVSGFAPSPEGKWLAVWARDPETPGEKKQKDAKADASWVNHELHGTRLYLAALKADGSVDGALKPVAILPDVRQVLWSPVADRMLVLTEEPNGLSDLGPAGAAWLVETASPDKPTRLNAVPATVNGGEFSPDGSTIVFAAQTPEDAPPGVDELFALPKETTGTATVPLTSGFAGQMNGRGLYFDSDGSLIASAGIGTKTMPVRIALNGKTPPAAIDLGASVVSSLNTNRKHTGWVWLADSGGQPSTLCFAAKLGDPCQTVNIPELNSSNLRMVKPELLQWQSDGLTIEGLLYLPPDTGTAKVPLIVDVHGGPHGAWEDRNDPFAAFMVGHGWAVLRPNPRGSSNYSVKFSAANKNDLGGGDYRDVMAGVDFVLGKYPLDANRMALMGYSYGGEMAGFVEGKTDRFKAIVSGAPVIDQFSEYGTEGGSWYDRWYYGKPWEHMDDAWKQSPLAGAAHAKTPFMMLQGQGDSTDPLGQSEEMYRALRQEGVPVELVTYPREDHGPLATGIFGRPSAEPWHGFDGRQRIVEFIEKGFGSAAAKP
ncbi:MAG TPA: prolyl oligopeptidase family serine peptidase [Terracidiphilus sp.]|jgi:dipeptidyl aminopeptidase/acylaminoacyl peptidase|nr:prolyl oligopeptidase family serine peptidase [Terracidiphilus sp.]